MRAVFMFPGQSSRYEGMLDRIAGTGEAAARVIDQASATLARDLLVELGAGAPDPYRRNRDIQLAVFVASHAMLATLDHAGVHAVGSLGLSLGEWNHLVHIGALDFEDALLAVDRRGAEYDAGPAGAMVSVFPVGLEELAATIAPLQEAGVLEIANLNSPRSFVLSGESELVFAAAERLEDELYLQPVVIEKRVPMHSSLFEPVGLRFAKHLRKLPFRRPRLPYLPNRLACPVLEPDSDRFVDLLAAHVYRPVRWCESIEYVRAAWPDAALVEVGPRRVLHNLLDRKWQPDVTRFHTDSEEDPASQIERVILALRSR